jgi:hypothetical protein
MEDLSRIYQENLNDIVTAMQESELYQQFLEEEDEVLYKSLHEAYEPYIAQMYNKVAANHPLQLLAFEKALLDPVFEGLFLPKILGYAVLRGEIDTKTYRYFRPQDHFRDILLAICQSSNFEFLKKRIGQTIQVGFALSSDIWITNLIDAVTNKRVRYFLLAQKNDKFRDTIERETAYKRYSMQFKNDNFFSAVFPSTFAELKTTYPALRNFLKQRIKRGGDNSAIVKDLTIFIQNPAFRGTQEHLEVMTQMGNFFELADHDKQILTKELNDARKTVPNLDEKYLSFLKELYHEGFPIEIECDTRISLLLDMDTKDLLSKYYSLLTMVHLKGFAADESIEAVKVFCSQYEGLAPVNECVRRMIFGYIKRNMTNMNARGYADYFELSKIFSQYMRAFGNQQFNQDIEHLSMSYVKTLMTTYTDKRGSDYQGIKRFVSSSFIDFGFLNKKEVEEMFKTRRKRKEEK